MISIGGYDPMKMMKALLSILLRKGLLTEEEVNAIVDAARTPKR